MQESTQTRPISLPGVWEEADKDLFVKHYCGGSAFIEAQFYGDTVRLRGKVSGLMGGVMYATQTLATFSVQTNDIESISHAIESLERLFKDKIEQGGPATVRKFTVIGVDEVTFHVTADHVWAHSPGSALINAAEIRKDQSVDLLAAVPGWYNEGIDTAFLHGQAFSGVEELRARHGQPLFELTPEKIRAVLSAYALRVTDTQGRSFAQMSVDLLDDLDRCEIVSAAMQAPHPELIEQHGCNAIKDALVRKGVLEF